MTKATVKDVAELAGVSPATVSQTLNNKGTISQGTRTKVLEAAQSIGYRHRSLIDQNQQALTMLTMVVKRDPDEKAPNPFHYHIIKGIEQQCRNLDIDLRFSSINVDENSHAIETPAVLNSKTDGFLLVGVVIDDGDSFLRMVGARPYVFVNGHLAQHSFDSVEADNRGGSYTATHYLIQNQHRRIAFLGGGKQVHPSINERRLGYQQAMQDHQLKPLVMDSMLLRPEQGIQTALTLLQNHPDITALVTGNDNLAISTMQAARTLGYVLPDDLSIIGFDDQQGVGHLTPALTTMHVDKTYMGCLGVQLLHNSALYPKQSHVITLVRPELIIRSSVQPFRKEVGLAKGTIKP